MSRATSIINAAYVLYLLELLHPEEQLKDYKAEREKSATNTNGMLFQACLLLALSHSGHLKVEENLRLEKYAVKWEDKKISFQEPQQTHTNGGYDSTQRKQRREAEKHTQTGTKNKTEIGRGQTKKKHGREEAIRSCSKINNSAEKRELSNHQKT